MQHSLCLVIAPVRTLMSGSLAGNAWLIHPKDGAEVAPASAEDRHDPSFTFPCTGVHLADGSMAEDVALNWIVMGINAIVQQRRHPLPLTDEQIEFAGHVYRLTQMAGTFDEIEAAFSGFHMPDGTPYAQVRLPDLPGVPRDIAGRPVSAVQALAGGFISPVLADVTGPAVDDGVIFPAQYGSPDVLTEGWYWSATVDTRRTGIHRIDLHLDLYRPAVRGRHLDFVPERHVLPTWLDVRAVPAVNGFTGGPLGYLPLPAVHSGASDVSVTTGGGPADA